MAAKKKTSSAKKRPAPKAKARARKITEAAAANFEQGLIARGEAQPATQNGKLPPGATHEITPEGIKRRRFSLK